MAFGDNVRLLRQQRGWLQKDLADKTGIKLNHISRLEKNENDPKLSTVYKLMKALDCNSSVLLADSKQLTGSSMLATALDKASTTLEESQQFMICEIIDAMCMAEGVASMVGENDRAKKWAMLQGVTPKYIVE